MDLRKQNDIVTPSEIVNFDQDTPTTGGVVFDPNTPATTDVLYVSSTNASTWIYNGTSYVTYNVPKVESTPFKLNGTTIDAGGNKTAFIQRDGSIRLDVASTDYVYYAYNSNASGNGYWLNLASGNTTGNAIKLTRGAVNLFTVNAVGKTSGLGTYQPNVQSVVSSATVTPNADTDDEVVITAQAEALTIANPSGTPTQGQPLLIRIKDNATARTIAFGSEYRAIGVTLPTTTVISKTLYIGCIYNSSDSKWDLLGINQEI